MERIFREKNWILFNQLPNLPITYVHDACIFLMMSKLVSRSQAMNFGCHVLKSNQLHTTVMNIWGDKTNREAMACSFSGHHQIVSSIMKEEGNNKYFSTRNGMHFGVRKVFVRDKEGDGVVTVQLSPEQYKETNQYRILNNRKCVGMKHSVLPMSVLGKAELTSEMVRFLKKHMEIDLMDNDVKEEWGDLVAGYEAVPM